MTEQEAIKEVMFNMSRIGLSEEAAKRVTEARDIAVKALEDIGRYRMIGTPEYILKLIDTQLGGLDLVDVLEKLIRLKKYEELGTLEEIEKWKEKERKRINVWLNDACNDIVDDIIMLIFIPFVWKSITIRKDVS